MADVTMPQLGETVTEGTITKWFKKVGDDVKADEPLFEVSTDKVDSEVPAPVGGTVSEILVAEGETVSVGTRLAVVGDAPAAAETSAPDVAAPTAASPEPESAPEDLHPLPIRPPMRSRLDLVRRAGGPAGPAARALLVRVRAALVEPGDP